MLRGGDQLRKHRQRRHQPCFSVSLFVVLMLSASRAVCKSPLVAQAFAPELPKLRAAFLSSSSCKLDAMPAKRRSNEAPTQTAGASSRSNRNSGKQKAPFVNQKRKRILTNATRVAQEKSRRTAPMNDSSVMRNNRTQGSSNSIRAKIEAARQRQIQSLKLSNNNITSNTAASAAQPPPPPPQLTQAYCDYLLAECVSHDEWDAVLDVLDLMKQANLRQVKSTYTACLQACFETKNAASAQEILVAMETAQIPRDASDYALVMVAMCRCDAAAHGSTAMTGGGGNQQQQRWWRQALVLHQQAVENGLDVPVFAYDAMLSCMAQEKQWKDAVRLLRFMEQPPPVSEEGTASLNKTRPALSTYRTVIECCVGARQAEQAVQVLQSCVQKSSDLGPPTAYAFELVIVALSKKLAWRRALTVLDLMETLQVPRSLQMYNAVLDATAKAREPVQAKATLVRMRRRDGMVPNIRSYNAVAAACASTSRWRDALAVLDQAHREPGVTPDVYTYTNAIRACAKGGKTRRALTLFEVVKDKGLPVDSYCYTAAIEACEWPQALKLLGEMEDRGIPPSEVTYGVAIKACGAAGQWRKALDLLEKMRSKKMPINLYVYNAAITAVSKAAKRYSKPSSGANDGQLWTVVMGLLDNMREDGIEPDGFSFSSAISCCGSDGRWEEALLLMDVMQKGGPKTRPNKIAYTAAIASCGRAGQVDHSLRLFRQMKDQGLSADRVAYNAVFSALRVSSRADAAFALWDEMLGYPTKHSSTTKFATANSSTRPDMITLTGAIAAMSSSDKDEDNLKVDIVFAEAVQMGVVLREDSLDSCWEFDLSGMSFPVARAACRFILHRIRNSATSTSDLTFITGVGSGKGQTGRVTSLREYIQEVIATEFGTALVSSVPERAVGTVIIESKALTAWLQLTQEQ